MRMKKLFSSQSTLVRLVLYSCLFGLALIALSCIGLFFSQPGWLIGASIGMVVSAINVVLLFKGSSIALKNYKASLFLLFYFTRMLLYVGMTVLLAYLDISQQIPAFKNSVFGLLIAFVPMVVVVAIVMTKEKKNFMNIGELK